MPGSEPTDDDRVAVAAGALTVAGASEYSGFSESALWLYMRAGELTWYSVGAKRVRYITRASLIELMARYLAAQRSK